MKKVWMCLAAIGGLVMLASSAYAADKTLALVVKGLDNPYFDLMHQGCDRANKELNKQGYTCYYTGPATAADESAEVQIIDDLLTKGVASMRHSVRRWWHWDGAGRKSWRCPRICPSTTM